MMDIILASHNEDKVNEFKEILPEADICFQSLKSLGFTEEIVEDGSTYKANAEIKAHTIFEKYRRPVLADDSGLSVDALDGYPGIYSARFAGVETAYKNKIQCLYELLKEIPPEEWTASFVCSLCYISATGNTYYFERKQQGILIDEMRGENGFGYDPIFYVPELKKTNAELASNEKHLLSHRGQALRAWYESYLRDELI